MQYNIKINYKAFIAKNVCTDRFNQYKETLYITIIFKI